MSLLDTDYDFDGTGYNLQITMLAKQLSNQSWKEIRATLANALTQEMREKDMIINNLQRDINHAIQMAKEVQPNYPWDDNHEHPINQAMWAVSTALKGVQDACSDLQKAFSASKDLTENLRMIMKQSIL